MSKHLLEDMVIVKHADKEIIRKEVIPKEIPEVVEIEREIRMNSAKNAPRYRLWFVAIISIVIFVFSISFLFGKAEIKVNPKMKDIVLNENLSADKDRSTDNLAFDLVVISGEESIPIKTTKEKDVKEVARGTVVIYNAFSSSPQPLNIDTRLEGSNGKIYKTQTKTVVPGMNKNKVPGSVEVKIYGNVAGPDYNSVPLDFKIFGFKGTSKYAKFYARSKGGITGGFIGKVPDISDGDKAIALAGLKNTLEVNLLKKATDQIPSGFILFKNASILNLENTNVPFIIKDKNFIMTEKGIFYGILFNEQKLTKKIVEDNIDKYDGSEVYIPNIENLVFSLSTQTGISNKDNTAFADMKNINFNLSGKASIVWKLDINKFTTDLLGKSKKEFNQVLSQYLNIDSATLMLSPLWKISIPNNAKDVKVIVNYPK